MILPDLLREAIADELISNNAKRLAKAREELSERYRKHLSDKQCMQTEAHRLSYLASRLPATYSAIHQVLSELRLRIPDSPPLNSFLDLGAGPGTGMWAVQEVFPEIRSVNLIEYDSDLIQIGVRLAGKSGCPALEKAQWHQGNLEVVQELPESDLILLSYSIGELTASCQLPLLEKCWKAAVQFLIIIEPGTPVGFERIRSFRKALLERGANLVAPCPHANECPIRGNDWCHFSVRVQRSALHRQIKEGALGHEDEKFSYLIFSKNPALLPSARILRHPNKRSGHIHFSLCTVEGLEQKTLSKRTPELYKMAKELEWGDSL